MKGILLLLVFITYGISSNLTYGGRHEGHLKKIQSIVPKGPYNCEYRAKLFGEELEKETGVVVFSAKVFEDLDTHCSVNVTYAVDRPQFAFPTEYRYAANKEECRLNLEIFNQDFKNKYGRLPTYSLCDGRRYRATLTQLVDMPSKQGAGDLLIRSFRKGPLEFALRTRWKIQCIEQGRDVVEFLKSLYPDAPVSFKCVDGPIDPQTRIVLNYYMAVKVSTLEAEKELDASWGVSVENNVGGYSSCLKDREFTKRYYEEFLNREVLLTYCSMGPDRAQNMYVVWK